MHLYTSPYSSDMSSHVFDDKPPCAEPAYFGAGWTEVSDPAEALSLVKICKTCPFKVECEQIHRELPYRLPGIWGGRWYQSDPNIPSLGFSQLRKKVDMLENRRTRR